MSHLMPSGDVRVFFQERVSKALENQHVAHSEQAEGYLVKLLTDFSATEPLTRGAEGRAVHAPLALQLKEALESPNPEEKLVQLRKLGDVALYVAGFFSDYVNRRLVDFDYYVSMGESAYASASSLMQRRSLRVEAAALYREMAEKFTKFVDVLAEISEESFLQKNQGVLRLYERWQRTQSPWSARKLKELGVIGINKTSATKS
jgi:hypothetical protein